MSNGALVSLNSRLLPCQQQIRHSYGNGLVKEIQQGPTM
jgi:hypothetical protein